MAAYVAFRSQPDGTQFTTLGSRTYPGRGIFMIRLSIAASILALGTMTASAADIAARPYTKAPPAPAVIAYDWSGFYLGINGGGAWSRKCWDARSFTIDIPVIGPPFAVAGPE